MSTKSKEKNSLKKLSSFLKETNEKITLNFTKINNLLSNTKNILNNNNNNNKLILNLNIELKNLENFLKNFFKEILSQINNINSNYNSTNNSEEENNFLDSTIKNSYNKVSNEFEEVEKKTIQIIKSLNINKEKRKQRIFLLEKKLQGFVDDVSFFNYQNIKKEFDINVNDNNKISNFILKNNIFIEKYKEIDYNENSNDNNKKKKNNFNYKILQNLNNNNNENSNDNNNNDNNDDSNNDNDNNDNNNDSNNNDNDNESIIQQLINIKTDEPNEIINVLESMINKKSNTSTIKNTKNK